MAPDATPQDDPEETLARELIAMNVARGVPFLWWLEGYSMGPRLGPHCEVLVDPARQARFGDVVLTAGRGGLVAHRIIARPGPRRNTYLTKGDQTFEMDAAANPGDLLGVLVGVRREGGLWQPWHWRSPFSRIIGA